MMQFSFFFLTAAASVIGTLASPAEYDDLVLTNIAVKDIGNNRVRFDGTMPGAKKSYFLTNVKNVSSTGWFWKRRPVFEAEIVPEYKLRKQISLSDTENTLKKNSLTAPIIKKRKPLLCIHGFNVQPEDHLEKCREYKGKFKKYKLIPVIWPSKGGIHNYYFDKMDGSKGAGRAFNESLKKFGGTFPRKCLLAHSMGNRVLRFAADPAFEFDNIFMVAADVDGDIFNKEYIGKNNNKGLLISKMLDPDNGGKVWVVQNKHDYALRASKIANLADGLKVIKLRPRLGAKAIDKEKLHEELKEKIDTVDAVPWLKAQNKNLKEHNYQFDDKAIEFYEKHY